MRQFTTFLKGRDATNRKIARHFIITNSNYLPFSFAIIKQIHPVFYKNINFKNVCFTKLILVLVLIVSIHFLPLFVAAQNQSSCLNADFEQNNFINWVGTVGYCCPINSTIPALVYGQHTIMSGTGVDPYSLGQIPVVAPGGMYSARLGNDNCNAQAEQLRYTFTVSPQTSLFIYRYAVVLEDPGHVPSEQPRFEIRVFDSGGNSIPCGSYNVVSSGNIPGFQNNGGIRFKTWSTVGIELSAYVNQSITIEFSTGDCNLGGHFGYAYVDCYCSPLIISSDVCPGTPIVTLTAPVGFNSYLWTTGQTTSAININNPVIGSQYNVTMTSVTGCTVSLSTVINATQLVSAYSQANNCQKWATFLDSSYVLNGTGVNNWFWNFGDGDSSLQKNPVHQYNLPGQYTVTLISGNAGGCLDTISKTINIIESPTAGFSFSGSSCSQKIGIFTDQSTFSMGSITNWNWDFGDGSSSVLQNPSHTYLLPGTYAVTLSIQCSNGCTDTVRQSISTISSLFAGFNFSVPCNNLPVLFSDSSSIGIGTISGWQWNFGDGNSSILQNPIHQYLTSGVYNATLIVTGSNGCIDTLQKTINVKSAPQPGFTSLQNCSGYPLLFTDTTSAATGLIQAWLWNFGDSTTSVLQNPLHLYLSDGTYKVELIVSDTNGCSDTVRKPVVVLPNPVSSFCFSNTCSNLPVAYQDSSYISGDSLVSWFWNFGDGDTSFQQSPFHQYQLPGIYLVTHIVYSNPGCSDTLQQNVKVEDSPVAKFNVPSICQEFSAVFTDQTVFSGAVGSYFWSFGDGNFSNLQNAVHIYTQQGSYLVTLWVTGMNGCSDSIAETVLVNAVPQANFIIPQACAGSSLQFADSSTLLNGNIQQWSWNFGDTSPVSNAVNPVHTYFTSTQFSVTLIVTSDSGCVDTISKIIQPFTLPVADFNMDTSCLNRIGSIHDLTLLSGGQIETWHWDFGDGHFDTIQNPVHAYTQTGVFKIRLTVETDQGCRDTNEKWIQVYPLPYADFIADAVCYLDTNRFQDLSSIGIGQVIDWEWNFGDGSMTGQTAYTFHCFQSPGFYTVQLEVLSDAGCINFIKKEVQVYALPVPEFSGLPLSGCIPLGVNFNDNSSSLDGNIIKWIWKFGDSSGATSDHPFHEYKLAGRYTVSLDVESSYGCRNKLEKQNYIESYPLPEADFSFSPENPVLLSEKVLFTDQSSGADQWHYIFGDGMESAEINPEHFYYHPGNISVIQIVANTYMCTDTIEKNIELHTDKAFFIPNAFSPNGDGMNDFFTALGSNIRTFTMVIFDRYGIRVFETNAVDHPWNGECKSQPAPEGTYVYRIVYEDVFGKVMKETGRVTLIR